MRDRYAKFRKTLLGKDLLALAREPHRMIEYAVLARLGVPSVAALAHDVVDKLPQVRHDLFAKQATGAFVGEEMRAAGYVLKDRVRCPGGLFVYGATWAKG